MENLNAEATKKALGCLQDENNILCDTKCHYYDYLCKTYHCEIAVSRDALALINSQEQRIKELAEELTRKETEYNELYELLQTYKADSEAYRSYSKTLEKENEALKTLLDESYDTQNSLTEENERLQDEADRYKRYYFNHEYDKFEAEVRADTVRKMAESIELEFYREFDEIIPSIMADRIDQIAKEMVEGN